MRRYGARGALSCLPISCLAAALAVVGISQSLAEGVFAAQDKAPTMQSPVGSSTGDKGRSPNVLVSSDEDYRIGPRDVLDVQVEDGPELSGAYNVSAMGTFLMPYLGRITAAGKTPEEIARLITEGLSGRYLKSPRVSVAIKQYNSRSFFIQGAVRSPGVYQIESAASLLKLIILAGGLTDQHGSTAFIIRELKPLPDEPEAGAGRGEKYEMVKVNINGLLKGHFDQNVMIEAGDIVNIPPTDVFFVAGEVSAPGSFPLKPGTTLRQAISLARGLTFAAAKSRGIVFREDPETGQRNDIKVDIGDVMSGKSEDILLMANDIVIVPNSRFKSVSGAILSAFGANVVTRGVRY